MLLTPKTTGFARWWMRQCSEPQSQTWGLCVHAQTDGYLVA